MSKIEEAQQILRDLALPSSQISALTLLALSDIKPTDEWQHARRPNITLTKGIMDFAKNIYKIEYKPNTRESFRKLALKPFIDNGIAELNPGNPGLSSTSSNTHYALTNLALKTIQKYNTIDWIVAVQNFKETNGTNATQTNISIKSISIKNFKSIVDTKIELGKVNVFIGANGCGKTNILEALAFVGASRVNDLTYDGLYSRGVRIARPNLITSSFAGIQYKKNIDILLELTVNDEPQNYSTSLMPFDSNDIYSKWYDLEREEEYPETIMHYMEDILEKNPTLSGENLVEKLNDILKQRGIESRRTFDDWLGAYSIYDLNTKTLRGITPSDSRKTPLGINGENLDLLIASFNKETRSKLLKDKYFDWLENVYAEPDDDEKYLGLKADKSISNLYFSDKYMNPNNKILSAENSNEGILHVLFYLCLFISDKTPKFLGIDNIETALNPRLCRVLIKRLVELAKDLSKQALITTHNPAILDGLNLLDDEQRLFEVYRNDEGYTETRRIKFKDNLSDKTGKLSQMWLAGSLGATPKNF
jgi:AAA15 family ATPase/GTPase